MKQTAMVPFSFPFAGLPRFRALPAALGVFLLAACAPPVEVSVTVDPEQRFQTMLGWEATGGVGGADYPEEILAVYRDAMLDLAVESIGLNRIRVEITTGVENTAPWGGLISEVEDKREWSKRRYAWVNDNDDPADLDEAAFSFDRLGTAMRTIVLPLRERLRARGEELYVNLCYVHFDPEAPSQLDDPEEYAELILATFLFLDREFGVVPDGVEVLLEPDQESGAEPAALAAGMVAAGDRLRDAAYTPDFIAPSTVSMAQANTYFDGMSENPRVFEYWTELSYHRYEDTSEEALFGIRRRAEEAGLQTSMLEHLTSSVSALHRDLTIAQVSSWQRYALGWPEPGGNAYVSAPRGLEGDDFVQANGAARHLRHYFRSARRGDVRIGARVDAHEVHPVAFEKPDGSVSVVLHTDRAADITFRNLPAGTYLADYTTEDEDDVVMEGLTVQAGGELMLSLPAPGTLSVRPSR